MRDIPLFTTEAGAASLTLKQIPYTKDAYVRLQASQEPEILLKECCDFCRAAGAEKIYATGNECLQKYPFHTAIWQMSRLREGLPETDAALFPVQQQTLEQWRTLYNSRMMGVPNAAYMTMDNAKKLLESGSAYFIHRGDTLLGIGIAAGETVDAVIAAVPGAGQDVLLALNHALSGERITVEVASENIRAIKLYKKLGFIRTAEISCWYHIPF